MTVRRATKTQPRVTAMHNKKDTMTPGLSPPQTSLWLTLELSFLEFRSQECPTDVERRLRADRGNAHGGPREDMSIMSGIAEEKNNMQDGSAVVEMKMLTATPHSRPH